MKNKIIYIIIFGILSVAKAETNILNVTFNSNKPGAYTKEMLKKDFPTLKWQSLFDRATIVKDIEKERGNVLKVEYPRSSVGPKEGGIQFLVSLPKSEDLWLSYYVKFEKGFDFRMGGKLPGLTSGEGKYTGGNRPKHGEGWSARYMWRKGGEGVIYLYYVDMPGKWGENLKLRGVNFEPGKWYKLVQHVKLNTDSKANGVVEVWVNGIKKLSRDDLRLRLKDKGLIDSFYFSTFHGGQGKEWAPYVKSTALYDDIVICTTPIK
ncbi:MAG: hypothetical protein PF692_08675 [Kiritimatiellae bacterium]|jgi:hypothetical protein|nr:hypothetical protein [Kiritimatiellia bacterium]